MDFIKIMIHSFLHGKNPKAGQHKNTDTNPCQTVLRASRNQAPTLSIQESPAVALNLSSGKCGLMLQRMVSVFLFVGHAFLRICRIRSDFPGPREVGEGNQEAVYRDSWRPFCHLHSGRNIRDIHGRREKNPSMEHPDFFLHTFILHKPLIFTTYLQIFACLGE